MGIPVTSAESFGLLLQQGVIDAALSEKLKRMVGFQNTVIHNYQRLELDVVTQVISSGLEDLLALSEAVRQYLTRPTS